jgi:DNA polymerase
VYLTNAVKHFKFERRGKVRIHKKPNRAEMLACAPWWQEELDALQPAVLGLLGSVAGQAVFGSAFRVTKQRGTMLDTPYGIVAVATIHPSAVLRAQERRDEEYAGLVRDLRLIGEVVVRETSGR